MKKRIVYKLTVGTSEYTIAIATRGGRVFVYQGKEHLCVGQWFPADKILMLEDCPTEGLKKIFEDKIKENIPEVEFPCIDVW